MFTVVLFDVFGLLMIVCAVISVTRRNPVHSALFLVLVFFLMATLFFLMEGFLVGIIQVLVYAGAIMVLFLFVIMLLNLGELPVRKRRLMTAAAALLVPAALFIQLFVIVKGLRGTPEAWEDSSGYIKVVGSLLFEEYLLPFEVVSLLLIAAMVGSVVLTKRELKR